MPDGGCTSIQFSFRDQSRGKLFLFLMYFSVLYFTACLEIVSICTITVSCVICPRICWSSSSRNYLLHFLKHRFCPHFFGQDSLCYLFVLLKIFISVTILILWHIKFPARIPPHFHNIIHQKPIT